LSADTADKIWERANEDLRQKEMLPQYLLHTAGSSLLTSSEGQYVTEGKFYQREADSESLTG